MNQFSRMELLFSPEAMGRLKNARVAVFGIGGVGGYVCEALARSSVGAIDLFDDDRVCITNLNRQLIALRSTVGQFKVDVMAARLRDINPDIRVEPRQMFYLPENADEIDFTQYSYVVDAVDTVTAKLDLITRCKAAGVPVISAMGAGNKLDPGQLKVADIYETTICPLARVMRKELRRRGVDSLKVVYSTEPALRPSEDPSLSCRYHCVCPPGTTRKCTARRDIPGSTAFVPPVMGLMIAREIVMDIAAGVGGGGFSEKSPSHTLPKSASDGGFR